ncbi:hypothetical protein J6590_059786 [Homalodisca vitripennis]|nr:hypothetical protein J6590_059786 [Homalodisca vitripennis]
MRSTLERDNRKTSSMKHLSQSTTGGRMGNISAASVRKPPGHCEQCGCPLGDSRRVMCQMCGVGYHTSCLHGEVDKNDGTVWPCRLWVCYMCFVTDWCVIP